MTGEKRMAIKTIKPITSGQEILVDYGGRFFAPDSSASAKRDAIGAMPRFTYSATRRNERMHANVDGADVCWRWLAVPAGIWLVVGLQLHFSTREATSAQAQRIGTRCWLRRGCGRLLAALRC